MLNTDYIIRCYETNEEIYSLKESWDELHHNSIAQSVYNSFDFIYESIEAFKIENINKKVFTLTDKNTGQLIAIFPFQKRKTSWNFIPFNTYETTALNEIMDKPFPVIRIGFHDQAWTAFITHLKSDIKDWDHLFLRDIPSSYPVLELLPILCSKLNLTCKVSYDCISTEIRLNDTWDDFWGKHKTMRRNMRKLEKKFGDRLAFTVHEDNWKSCLDDYIALERKGWKNGLGVTKNNDTINFYYRYCEKLNESGQLKFGYTTVDDQLIAGIIAYTQNDNIYFAQGCYDPAYKKFSPTMVNMSYFLRYLYGTNFNNVDCLCGYADYANKWTDKEIETYDVDIYASRPKTRLVLAGQTMRNTMLALKSGVKNALSKPATEPRRISN